MKASPIPLTRTPHVTTPIAVNPGVVVFRARPRRPGEREAFAMLEEVAAYLDGNATIEGVQ